MGDLVNWLAQLIKEFVFVKCVGFFKMYEIHINKLYFHVSYNCSKVSSIRSEEFVPLLGENVILKTTSLEILYVLLEIPSGLVRSVRLDFFNLLLESLKDTHAAKSLWV